MALLNVDRYNVVLFFGSPHCGKTLYYCMHLLSTHGRVSPDEIFRSDPSCSLRQLILEKIVSIVRKGGKVVVDDDAWSYTKRDSIVSLTKKRVPSSKFLCVQFHSQYGKDQILYSREFQLGEALEMKLSTEHVNMGVSDGLVDIWLKYENGQEIGLTNFPTPDKPRETEGYTLKDINLGFVSQSKYQFEVPTLFIQWEGIVKASKDGHVKLPNNAIKSLNMWYKQFFCGRIIIIWDGKTSASVSGSEKENMAKNVLREIYNGLEDCVVYLMHIESSSLSGCYTIPPNPGILAFIQRLHLVDLNHRGTMYLYHTASHQKMAEKVGVKQIKASRIFDHPHLVVSGNGCTKGIMPEMLRSMRVVLPEDSERQTRQPGVPLYNEAKDSDQNILMLNTPQGRTLYIAFKNKEVLERYNKEYADNASEVGSGESKIALTSTQIQESVETQPSSLAQRKQSQRRSTSGEKLRSVPKWMQNKPKKHKRADSLLPSSESPDESPIFSRTPKKKPKMESKSSRTIYIMSEAELVETATSILQEAGRPIPASGSSATILEDLSKVPASSVGTDTVPVTIRPASTRSISVNVSSPENTHEILQDLLGFKDDKETKAKAPSRKGSGGRERKLFSHDSLSDDDVGDTEALLDELLGSGRKAPPRRPVPLPRTSGGDFDVFRVPDTSSSEESQRRKQQKNSPTVADSFVEDSTSSGRSRSSKCSSVIPDSYVSETSSAKSGQSKSSSRVPDSFASETSSNRSGNSKSSSVIPDSHASESSGMNSRQSGHTSAGTVPDSYVKDTSSEGSKRSSSSMVIGETPPGAANDNSLYRVPETVTTIPETAQGSVHR